MTKIAITNLHLHQPSSLSDLALSEMEQVLGGTSVSYSLDLEPLQNSLSNLSSYFNLSGSDSPSACGVHNKRKCVPKGKFRNAPSACGGDRNFSAPQLLLVWTVQRSPLIWEIQE
jgi:hypothetical protein